MRKPILFVVLAVLIAGGLGAAWYVHSVNEETAGDIAANDSVAPESVMTPVPADAMPAAGTPTEQAQPLAKPSDIHITVDGMDPKSPRSIGPMNAPVTITEFSSLTCPHCAHAHETILPQLIKEYVETGKLRIVFSDFPLNQEAMDASKVSRCVPNDQYFNFLSMLFGSIEQWAYSNNHPNALIQDAVLAGLPEDQARACLGDAALEKALVEGVQAGSTKYNINATPTFIFNDGAKTISGARPYKEFKAAIDELLAAKPAQ